MKRTLIILLCLLAPLTAVLAQKGLHVAPIFQGEVIPKKRMMETMARGESLEKYKLTLFHSLKMNVDVFERGTILERVLADVNGLESKNVEWESENNNVAYCIACLPGGKSKHRYLCYQCYEASQGGFNITLVYLEGSASMSDLRKTFKKK